MIRLKLVNAPCKNVYVYVYAYAYVYRHMQQIFQIFHYKCTNRF